MRRMSAGDVRERFSEIVNEAAFADKRTVITRHGKEVAAIVPIGDLSSARTHSKTVLPEGSIMIRQSPEILTISASPEVRVTATLNSK
jgi:prevent-host-death family protein